MASSEFYRKQAQTFASLALTSANNTMAQLYNQMALEYLAKAEESEPSVTPLPPMADGGDANADRT